MYISDRIYDHWIHWTFTSMHFKIYYQNHTLFIAHIIQNQSDVWHFLRFNSKITRFKNVKYIPHLQVRSYLQSHIYISVVVFPDSMANFPVCTVCTYRMYMIADHQLFMWEEVNHILLPYPWYFVYIIILIGFLFEGISSDIPTDINFLFHSLCFKNCLVSSRVRLCLFRIIQTV